MSLWTTDGKGGLDLNLHYGQSRALLSEKRVIAVLAGTGGGKTSFGPIWLWHEIQKRGADDYLAISATYDLFKLRMLPTLLEWFIEVMQCAKYYPSDRILVVRHPEARIILRSAESAGGLESSVAKAAWFDEAGQDNVDVGVWEALNRRLAINQGRCLITTTPYNLGWLKSHIYDRWRAGDTDIDVIQFDSTANPAFPKAEYERARASMPLWKFNMFYRGRFERPAGLIYDCFNEGLHVRPRFAIPAHWPRYLGLDFGGVNTAGIFLAGEMDDAGAETGRLYLYREYKAGGRTAAEHTAALLRGEPMTPFAVGGSKSEGQWRREFATAGLGMAGSTVKEVEVGIGRVYGAIKRGQLHIFDDCTGTLDELRAYSRELDSAGEPTEKIADKETYHHLDALRYIVGFLKSDMKVAHL